ncbi:MAG TPA: zf-HC2 domain-containing protein [Micromonosporaceae bacterium]
MSCERCVDAGAYVLGALAPTERSEYERHLAQCEPCRDEVADLAVLPGLLGRLDPAEAAAVDQPVTAPAGLLDRVVSKARKEQARLRRRRRWQTAGAALAAACLALVVGLGAGRLVSPAAPPPAAPVVASMRPVQPDLPLSAVLGYAPKGGGTDITMVCVYQSSGGYAEPWQVTLVVYPRGSTAGQNVATWPVTPGESSFSAHASVPPDRIGTVELRRADGGPLLTYQHE